MSDDNEEPPIEVSADPTWDQLTAGLRQVATPLIAFALGRHWIEGDTATALGSVLAFGIIVAGQMHTRRRAKQLAAIAKDPRVPDEVAKVV